MRVLRGTKTFLDPRNTQNARCVCFVMSIDLIFCLHMPSAPSPEYATSGDYSSDALVSSSVGLSSPPAVACCPRNTPSSRLPCFQHYPRIKCLISCRTLQFSLPRTTFSAPSISKMPDFLSDALVFLVQESLFLHRPTVECPISCRTLSFSLSRTTISAPSHSRIPDFLSDVPVFIVQNHYFSTVPQ